jgi:phosphatidylinositol glycan class B
VSTFVQWIRQAWEPGEITLGRYLTFAFLVRLPATLFSRGYDFLDHQHQYIDPAYHLGLGGSWHLYHEYVQGLRSWVYPGILGLLFKLIAWIGVTEPLAMMAVTRFVHSLFSLVPVAAFWWLIVKQLGWTDQRPLLLFFAANWILVYCGVQPTGPTFAVGLSLTAVFLSHGRGRGWPLLAGLLLGLAFACRFQDAFFGPVLLGAYLVRKQWQEAVYFCCGCAVAITMQGVVDLMTWGGFLHSPFRYVHWNVFLGKMATFGVQPWWLYIAYLCGVLLLVPPFLRSGWGTLVEGTRRLPVLFMASAFYIFLLSLVVRKDFRFVFHAMILILIVYAGSLLYTRQSEAKVRTIHRRLFVGVHLTGLILASFWYPMRGPIEAAVFLSGRDDFRDRLVVVDGTNDDVGGHFYLQRRSLDIIGVEEKELADWLAREFDGRPVYLMTVADPLVSLPVPDGCVLDELGAFNNRPDFQTHARRFVYRVREVNDGKKGETNGARKPL